MKILLDENLPHKLRHSFAEHEAFTAAYLRLDGLKNGALLAAAVLHSIQVVVTCDSGMQHSQNIPLKSLSVIVLEAPSNDYDDLVPLMPQVLRTLKNIRPGKVIVIGPTPAGS